MRNLLSAFIWILICTAICLAQSESAFTFQGKLNDGGVPANGNYDMAFRIFDAPGGAGTQIGSTVSINNVPVANGIFSVELDFGHLAFVTVDSRFLEIGIRRAGTTDPLTILSPRQKITGSPFASQSFNATIAANANSATFARGLDCSGECVQSDEIESVAGSKVTGAVSEAATVSDGAGGGILNVSSITGIAGDITGPSTDFVFVGPTASVTVPTGQSKRITGSANIALSGLTSIRYGLCHQIGGGTLFLFNGTSLLSSVKSDRLNYSYSGSALLSAGTYNVGFCVRNFGSTITSTESVVGWIMAPK